MVKTSIRLSDNGHIREYTLDYFDKDAVVIGRGSDCDIRLSGATVSTHHGCFFRNQGQWGYQDMMSSNGSSINGSPISSITIRHGDRIYLNGKPKNDSAWFEVNQEEGTAPMNYKTYMPELNSYGGGQPMNGNGYGGYAGNAPGYGYASQGHSPQYVPYQQRGVSGMGIASLVLGILSLLAAFSWSILTQPVVLGIMALLAVIFGLVSVSSNKRGKGMGVAGLVCGAIALIRVVYVWVELYNFLDSF